MKTKPITPYQRLLKSAQEFARQLNARREVQMFNFPADRLSEGWGLTQIYERTVAAKSLGYDVLLEADQKGLTVKYVKKVPAVPYEFRY